MTSTLTDVFDKVKFSLYYLYIRLVLVLIFAFGLTACRHLPPTKPVDSQPPKNVQSDLAMFQRVEFTTQDGITIVADWYSVDDAIKAALLVHMLPAAKESYADLAKILNSAGISALAIDLRGHGESTAGPSGKLDFQTFSPPEHQASIADLEAAIVWLNQQGFPTDKISLIGASIGANLSLQAAAGHPEITKIILLSPGLDYHGVQTEPFITKLPESTQILLLSSGGDDYAADSIRRLQELRPASQLKLFPGSSHGTDLLDDNFSLQEEISKFLR